MSNTKKKFNLFNAFNPQSDGPGVKKEPQLPLNLKNFFVLYGRNFSNIFSINLYTIFSNFPLIFALIALTGIFNKNTTTPMTSLFAPLYGAMQGTPATPVTAALSGVIGIQTTLSQWTTATYIVFGLSALVLFTFGFSNIGTTYLLRNIVRGEPLFMWSDFWYAIKRNKKQGFIMGILDLVILGMLTYNILFYYFNISNFLLNMMFYASVVLFLLYFVMRFYIYIMIITFDLKLVKVFKNALIFTILGFKRNILAFIGIALLVFFDFVAMYVFMPLGLIIPFIILFSTGAFMAAYAAYPKIKQIMIDPYETEKEEETKEEPIFKDMG